MIFSFDILLQYHLSFNYRYISRITTSSSGFRSPQFNPGSMHLATFWDTRTVRALRLLPYVLHKRLNLTTGTH
jgi:hypothetical protein